MTVTIVPNLVANVTTYMTDHLQCVTQTENDGTVDCYTVTLYLALVKSGFGVLTVEGEDNI